MQIVDSPPLAPGACFITNGTDGPFIDTLIDVDDRAPHGRVYIAVSTLTDMLGLVGGMGPEGVTYLRTQNVALAGKVAELEQMVQVLTETNQTLLAAGYQGDKADFGLVVPPDLGYDETAEWIGGSVSRAQAVLAVENQTLAPRPRIIELAQSYLTGEPEPAPAPVIHEEVVVAPTKGTIDRRAVLEALSDDDILSIAIEAGHSVPADTSRDQLIDLLTAVPA